MANFVKYGKVDWKYEKLPELIKRQSYTLMLIKRNPEKALYAKMEGGETIEYHLFWIRVQKAGKVKIKGKIIDKKPKERYPKPSDFGKKAWSFNCTWIDAVHRYNNLI